MNFDPSWGEERMAETSKAKRKKKKIVAVVSFHTVEKYIVFTSVAFNPAYEFLAFRFLFFCQNQLFGEALETPVLCMHSCAEPARSSGARSQQCTGIWGFPSTERHGLGRQRRQAHHLVLLGRAGRPWGVLSPWSPSGTISPLPPSRFILLIKFFPNWILLGFLLR